MTRVMFVSLYKNHFGSVSFFSKSPQKMEKMKIFFGLVLSLLFVSPSAFLLNDRRLGASTFPSLQAEKLIRQLNLFPKEDVNVVDGRQSAPLLAGTGKRIVEKRINLLGDFGGGVTVEDLGHHAGYYKLPHSHDAKYFSKTLKFIILLIY